MKKFWEANFLILEMLVPGIVCVLFVVWSAGFDKGVFVSRIFAENRGTLYSTLAALFGSMLGFVITAVSIILGYANNEKLEIVRESKYYPTIWSVFKSTIKILAIATLLALVGLVVDKDVQPLDFILYLNIYFVVISFFRIGRCIWVLENIIAIVTKKSDVTPNK